MDFFQSSMNSRRIEKNRAAFRLARHISKIIIQRGRGGPNCHFQSLNRGTELDRGIANSTEGQRPSPQKQPILITMSEQRGNIFQLKLKFFVYKFIKFDKCIFL